MEPVAFILIMNAKHVELVGIMNTKLVELQLKYAACRTKRDCKLIMDYEANSRIRDPVYGCAGAVYHLQKQVSELQAELAKAQAGLASMQSQQQNLIALICMEMAQSQEQVLHRHQQQQPQQQFIDTSCFLDEYSLGSTWEPLWT
ncbi:LOB domain-containing protein 1 [Citrus sinensis]|nr:LOB domain-containing protein 1 [Citrus sinensis]